jgi:flagellar protein FliS
MTYGAKNYKQTAIKTASPEQILLMMYEAAIKSAKLAKQAMEKGQLAEKGKQIAKVHDIVNELNSTLDHQRAADVAAQLASLYEFCVSQLLKANIQNDLAAMDSVVKVLTTLYEGWVGAINEVRKTKKEKA